MLVAFNWFRLQMKAYFSARSMQDREVIVDDFVKNGFFTSAVEGGRILARVESKNNGYLTTDDFNKFMHHIAQLHNFSDVQFNAIRQSVHVLGGKRLEKEMSRAKKFEIMSQKMKSLAKLSLPVKKNSAKSSSSPCIAPEHNETVVSSAKGGGVMYFAKPRHKHKLLHFLSNDNIGSNSPVEGAGSGHYSPGHGSMNQSMSPVQEKRRGSIDKLDDEAVNEEDLLLHDAEEAAQIEASTKKQEAIIDITVGLMDRRKKSIACAGTMPLLSEEACENNIKSSSAMRFVYNAEKIILQNRSMPNTNMKKKASKSSIQLLGGSEPGRVVKGVVQYGE
eukprot:CAMPEP_0114449596 /NCGR_PEP_ID=MMETSP0104-20121206/17_1 /TAXON_ID=37642 ORGANISM="Paraphysomonas imperforata, Strain PA2" /NCGR_SAMPLE_ID=MMETSP0104 /ASSEMBLY_ACC=CAM_ASM_000202 /LENGTH=333 /DNA_ID=CAMNT_0001621693 /DNA_START=413 /DNA_END=1414 /DNA_ORIENTATION=+